MGNFIYTCTAIALEEDKKVKCTVNIAINEIQLIGKFANHAKSRTIKFNDFRLLSTNMGKEKLGLFKKDYIEIVYNGKCLRKLYFKDVVEAHNFSNAIKFKQGAIRNEDEKKRIEEKKRKDGIYNDACALVSKCTIESLSQAITKFQSIKDWLDSESKIVICNNEIKKLKRKQEELEKKQEEERKDKIYNKATSLMKQDTPSSYKKAFDEFKKILNWKNSKELSSVCATKLNEVYNFALALMSAPLISTNTVEDLNMAITKFQEIIGWKDSQEKINVCRSKIDEIEQRIENEIKQKKEEERKEKLYQEAINLINRNYIEGYEIAIKKLTEIDNWKDSNILIDDCKKRIAEIKRKLQEERCNKIYTEATELMKTEIIENYEQAKRKFIQISGWLDSEKQIDICNKKIHHIREAEFYNDINKVVTASKQEDDNPQKYSDNIKSVSKSAIDLIIKNPYFVLGISCTSEQSKMLDVRDKIEKFARLKLAGGYKSTFDLKNIEKPSRDISSIQAAIVAAKDVTSKWLWFETDKYCSWWDKDEIFSLYEKEQDYFEYDLVLACMINAMICGPSFADSRKWNIVFAAIDNLIGLPTKELLKILKKHISDETLNDEEIISSFKDSILKPITLLFENASKEQIANFSKIKIPKIMSDAISSSMVLNVTNLCYPLDIYVKEVENDASKTDINKLLSLINTIENSVYKNIDAYISIVGPNSTYAKRIKKKYKDAIWNATVILNNNSLKNKSIPYIKEIYEYCDEGDKQRLRNTYGYKELGLLEDELTPGEMNDVALEYLNNGDKIKGISLLKKAANGGDANAQSNLAFRYYNGDDGVQKNIDTAINWWKKSGNQGNPTAQHALFMFYMEEGYRQNIGEAMRWLRKSCDQNFKPSMEVFEKVLNMAKSYDYQERNAGLDLLRKMGLDV